MPDVFQVDVGQLNTYLGIESPRAEWATPRAILDTAAKAFLAAGVLKLSGRPLPAQGAITVDRTGITLKADDKRSFYWTDDRILPLDGLIAGLAYHLAATMNQAPTPGPWPKQLDEAE